MESVTGRPLNTKRQSAPPANRRPRKKPPTICAGPASWDHQTQGPACHAQTLESGSDRRGGGFNLSAGRQAVLTRGDRRDSDGGLRVRAQC